MEMASIQSLHASKLTAARQGAKITPRPTNLDLAPNLVNEIGSLVAHWSYLESQIDRVISYLRRLGPENGRLALSQLPIVSRLDMARELISRAGTIDRHDFEALRDDIISTKSERDQIVECAWVWDSATGAHYPAVEKDRPSNPHAAASTLKLQRLIHQRAREIRKKVDFLNQRTQGLFHALVKSLPSHIRVIDPLSGSLPGERNDVEQTARRRVAS